MTARRRSKNTTRHLDRLRNHERSTVLSTLLAAHPELLAEADEVASRLHVTVDPDTIAADVVASLGNLDTDDLANRAGRHCGGYVEAN